MAAAFTGGIDFEVARRVAGLEEQVALDALDAALAAPLLVAASGRTGAYDFTHALVRHTLYEALSPARQVRLHRAIAEAMESVYGERAVEHVQKSRDTPSQRVVTGAERGVPTARRRRASQRTAAFARLPTTCAALDLLPATAPEQDDSRTPGPALAYVLKFEDGARVALKLPTRSPRRRAVEPQGAIWRGGRVLGTGRYARAKWRRALDWVGDRDATWAILKTREIVEREINDPTG